MNTDYPKLYDYCDEMLRANYPNSKKFTPFLKNKTHKMLEEIECTLDDFDKGLALYEETEEYGDAYSPSAKMLKKYIVSSRGDKELSTDNNKMVKYFAAMVKDHGWEEAYSRFSHGTSEEKDWMSKFSVDAKYCCFPSWYKEYLEIFFTGDIIESQRYYIEHTDKADKTALYQELDNYIRIGNNRAKKSFVVFRPKVKATPKTLEQLRRFKLKGRLSKDRV